MIRKILFPVVFVLVLAGWGKAEEEYLVLVDESAEDFKPAAERMAALHDGELVPFDPSNLDALLDVLRRRTPRYVVFVIPPHKIDVDLSHDILSLATRVDADPFVDFEYGFITGRDGAAARRFVERVAAVGKKEVGRKAAMFGSWEGQMGPMRAPLSAMKGMGLDGESHYVKTRDDEETRRKDAREALAKLEGRDVLLFFSHGYPDEMAVCYRAPDLRDWKVDLSPAILINCACYNGAPGRWFEPGPGGPVDRGVVDPEASVALAVLDSGVTGYISGIDPWHGPLAFQVFGLVFGDGLRLGEATKRMVDRLAIEFHPEPLAFKRTMDHKLRFSGEGTNNRRHNGAGMIFYGDPAYAPYARQAPGQMFAELQSGKNGKARIRMGSRPLLDGQPGEDFLLPTNRLLDYYSVKNGAKIMEELAMEIYQVVPLPIGHGASKDFKVVSCRTGKEEVEASEPQLLLETNPWGDFLHVRVPLAVRWFPPGLWPLKIANQGVTIELVGTIGAP